MYVLLLHARNKKNLKKFPNHWFINIHYKNNLKDFICGKAIHGWLFIGNNKIQNKGINGCSKTIVIYFHKNRYT